MIGLAIQKGSIVEVYGERNNYLFSRSGELYGFTSTTVSIKKGSVIEIYNDKGSYVGSRHA